MIPDIFSPRPVRVMIETMIPALAVVAAIETVPRLPASSAWSQRRFSVAGASSLVAARGGIARSRSQTTIAPAMTAVSINPQKAATDSRWAVTAMMTARITPAPSAQSEVMRVSGRKKLRANAATIAQKTAMNGVWPT